MTTSIKKNLYYEIKDKVIEERSSGTSVVRKTQKTKVYGLDSSKTVRDLLIQILRERMQYHKDKFVSPYIYDELLTLEVKKNGKVEHSQNGHDDTIFAYLMAMYVWYEGKDLMERWGIQKDTIRTDQDLEEAVVSIDEKYSDIIQDLGITIEEDSIVQSQLDALNSVKAVQFKDWAHAEFQKDLDAIDELMLTPLGRKAVKEHYNLTDMDIDLMSHKSGGAVQKEIDNYYGKEQHKYEYTNIVTPAINISNWDQI